MKYLLIPLAIIAAIFVLAWLGIKIKPASFAPVDQKEPALETVPMPEDLPAPVERYFRNLYGDNIPVIKTAVVSGRGTLRLKGIVLPMRFRITHEAGQNYRHYFEITFFGLPVIKVNEAYLNGKERMEFPWGVDENNPKLDQGGALGMWAETIMWFPSVLLTDPQVRWEAIDDETAFLVVPFNNQPVRFLFRFDPACKEILYWEVMRYMNGVGEKTLWINGTWFVEGSPWAYFNEEETLYNIPVDVKAKGE